MSEQIGIEHSIIQGPFGGGYSTARLVAAVSNGGGLGSYGAHHLTPQQILETAASIRALTAKPYSLNIWVSNRDFEGDVKLGELQRTQDRLAPYYRELGMDPPVAAPKPIHNFEDQAYAVIEARPAAFSFVFGVPPKAILDECRRRGIVTIGAATTVDEAKVLEEAGVDIVVASGFEGGGHRPSFLAPAEDSLMGAMALVPQIAQAVRCPVIAAGGIADRRGVAAALKLGADAAQVGTAFLACEESGAPEVHRKLLFDPAAQRTVLSRVYSGRLARGLCNRLHDELRAHPVLPYPAQGWVIGTMYDTAVAQGRSDLISLWSGQSAGLLRHHCVNDLLPALLE